MEQDKIDAAFAAAQKLADQVTHTDTDQQGDVERWKMLRDSAKGVAEAIAEAS